MAAQQSMIEYYEAGGPNNSQIYRTRAADYKRKLRDEYYDNDNPRGPRALYYILKVKFPDNGPHPEEPVNTHVPYGATPMTQLYSFV